MNESGITGETTTRFLLLPPQTRATLFPGDRWPHSNNPLI